MWAQENGHLDSIRAAVGAAGRTYEKEIHDLYVSTFTEDGVLDYGSGDVSTMVDSRAETPGGGLGVPTLRAYGTVPTAIAATNRILSTLFI